MTESVTAEITCSFPLPSIMISPSLSSAVNLVPKPVILPLAAIDTLPVNVLSPSATASAVKSASPEPLLSCPIPLTLSMLNVLTWSAMPLKFYPTTVNVAVPSPSDVITSLCTNVPTTS